MIVDQELGYDLPQVLLAQGDHPTQTLGPCREHESFGDSLQIGTSGGQLDSLHAAHSKDIDEALREQRIAIMDQVHAPGLAIDREQDRPRAPPRPTRRPSGEQQRSAGSGIRSGPGHEGEWQGRRRFPHEHRGGPLCS